jgi:hypothetical protein
MMEARSLRLSQAYSYTLNIPAAVLSNACMPAIDPIGKSTFPRKIINATITLLLADFLRLVQPDVSRILPADSRFRL